MGHDALGLESCSLHLNYDQGVALRATPCAQVKHTLSPHLYGQCYIQEAFKYSDIPGYYFSYNITSV